MDINQIKNSLPVGIVSWINGEESLIYDEEKYLKTISNEIETANTSGFSFTTLTLDSTVRKKVSKIIDNFYGVDSDDKKETVVVNLLAGPGAGKTTCAWDIAQQLKKLDYVVEYVPEYAKELVWEESWSLLDGSIDSQKHIMDVQKHRIDRLIGKVDFVVTDRPLIMDTMYLKAEGDERKLYEETVVEIFNEYNNFNLFVNRGERFEKEGRIHDYNESIEIDKNLKSFLKNNEIFFGNYSYDTIDLSIKNCIAYKKGVDERNEIGFDNPVIWEKVNKASIVSYAQMNNYELEMKNGQYRLKDNDQVVFYEPFRYYNHKSGKGGNLYQFINEFEESDKIKAFEKAKIYTEILPYAEWQKRLEDSYNIKKELFENSFKNGNIVFNEEGNLLFLFNNYYPSIRLEYNDKTVSEEYIGREGYLQDNDSDTLVVTESIMELFAYQSLDDDPLHKDYLALPEDSTNIEFMLEVMEERKYKNVIIAFPETYKYKERVNSLIDLMDSLSPGTSRYINNSKGDSFLSDWLEESGLQHSNEDITNDQESYIDGNELIDFEVGDE